MFFIFLAQIPATSTYLGARTDAGAFYSCVLQDSTALQTQSGKMSRRAKAALKRMSMLPSETEIKADTSASVLEAIRALPRDSSARLEQFKYVRTDRPAVSGVYHKNYPLFLASPPIVKYKASLDSSKWVYRLRRTLDDHDLRIPVDIPMEEYTTLRLKQAIRQNWESLTQSYTLKEERRTTLGELMGKITRIEVPIPKNPIFSIFGKNYIRMNINGSINIQAGFSSKKSDTYSLSAFNQDQTIPEFKQEIQVGVKGEIGDKLKIDADWNTQRTFEYENQLHVKYQGYEDEIIQSVEAGNVSLPTESAFISGGQALFGITAKMQFGPLNLTTVATQKKGEIKEMSLSGGGTVNNFEIRPTDYLKNHFFIDSNYKNLYENRYLKIPAEDPGPMRVREIEVWVTSQNQLASNDERNVVAFIDSSEIVARQNDLNARRQNYDPVPGLVETGRFKQLVRDQDYDFDEYSGILSLRTSVPDNYAVAVAYITSDTIGNSSRVQTDTTLKLIMKLVKPKNLDPQMKDAWKLMLKNRYSLNAPSVDRNSFDFYIEYQNPDGNPVRKILDQNIDLLRIFGLDRYDDGGNPGGDDKFDYMQDITIDEKHGEIIFPTVEPFNSESIEKFLRTTGKLSDPQIAAAVSEYAFPKLYDTTSTGASKDIKNRYYMRGTVKGGRSDIYHLGFNVVEGSVQVISGGQRLVAGVDYSVDYISGDVKILNKTYLSAGQDLQIKYEGNDLFQLASKSLLGARGKLDLGKNTSLGFTIMNYSQQSLSDKVRLGEEPMSNTMMGIDGGTVIDAPWLTNAVNYLPGMQTVAPSQISLRGEVAYMKPNPNTRTSPIGGDGSKGSAYIDDFEGARQIIPLGVNYSTWKDASAPWYISKLDLYPDGYEIPTDESYVAGGQILSDVDKMEYKAKAGWITVQNSVTVAEIWGDRKQTAKNEQFVTAMDFFFNPAVRGAYNYSMRLDSTIGFGKTDANSHVMAWGGMQHLLGTTNTNLTEQNVAFIEFWIKIASLEAGNDSAKLNIDLGYISEDVIPDRKIEGEDRIGTGYSVGSIDEKKDVGLDMLNNSEEAAIHGAFLAHYPNMFDSDPAGDDFYGRGSAGSIPEQFSGINGTQGNLKGIENGIFPDNEDLNKNNNIDRLNAYLEYEIPLNTGSITFKSRIAGQGENNWYQIRIPLSEFTRRIGDASLSKVEAVRMWITGAKTLTWLRLVDLNLVGNQWEKRVKPDSLFEVGVVNYEDNPKYSTPPGVAQVKDPTRPDENILLNEQSLSLIYTNLEDGKFKEAVKYYDVRPLDMFNYKTMKMFVHGETGDAIKQYDSLRADGSSAEVFIHFGTDTLNYYEYRAPVRPGWIGNNVVIQFSELTSIKNDARDTTNNMTAPVPVSGGQPGATYRVRGSPRLDRIVFISIGIHNPEGKGEIVISGELWANELRLTDVDDTPGWAYRIETGLKLADFSNISFTFTQRDPFFHGLEEHFGSRSTTTSWGLAGNMVLAKLLPESWNGTVLTVNYSHSEDMAKPRYLPGTDVLVDETIKRLAGQTITEQSEFKSADDVRLKSENLKVSNTLSIPTLKFNIPWKSWLVRETINKMTFGYNYSDSRRRDPVTEYAKAWRWDFDFKYATDFSPDNYFSLAGVKIFYSPKMLSFRTGLTRSQNQTKTRTENAENVMTHDLTSDRGLDFGWQFFQGKLMEFGLSYSVSITSTLHHLNVDKNNNLRPLSSVLGDIFFSDRLINFGIDRDYAQSITFNTKTATPKIWSLDRIVTFTPRYSSNYRWSNNIQAGPLGRGVGVSGSPGFTLDISLKPIADAIWPPVKTQDQTDTTKGAGLGSLLKQLDPISRILFKIPIFDFDKFSLSFNQTNTSQNNSIFGSTGFANLFARVPFFQSSLPENGPSIFYQLGLASDPNGYLVLKTKGTFPFFTGYTVPGIRAPNASINNVFSQTNQFSLSTSRPLWEGVSLQLNWRLSWSYNESRKGITDSLGNVIWEKQRDFRGNIERSYLFLPPVFIFKFFKTSLENVNDKYQGYRQDKSDTRPDAEKLSKAFEEGLEALPWLTKIIGSLAPRANWSIRWDGLEKFSLFNSFAQSMSIDHSYRSSYTEGWYLDQLGNRVVDRQGVSYKFDPLLQLSITFKEFLKGNLSTRFRYDVSTSYALVPSSSKATENPENSFTVVVTFSKQGFEIPLFGISLMNNIDISFNYDRRQNKTIIYDFSAFDKNGLPQTGSSTVTLGPSINYSLSERITAGFTYTYTKFSPDEGGATASGYTMNSGRLNVRILIQ